MKLSPGGGGFGFCLWVAEDRKLGHAASAITDAFGWKTIESERLPQPKKTLESGQVAPVTGVATPLAWPREGWSASPTRARCSSREQTRYEAPGEWGHLLCLDRLPEVKSLRAKIALRCQGEGKAAQWK